MSPFQSLRDYERFIYTLQSQDAALASSRLSIERRGRFLAELTGELLHRSGYRLVAYERLTWDAARYGSLATVTKCGRETRSSSGMTRSHILLTRPWQVLILTTNTYRPT
ncbi:MAG: hypothetical protein FJ387_28205 [Verrucomicrobia bacterium]|nr:hypothetical protein [Verrucomicrobiota bacterium]